MAYLLPPLAWGAPRRRPFCLTTPHEREGHKATGKKTPGDAGTPRDTRAHAGTRITRTNLTTKHPNPTTHPHDRATAETATDSQQSQEQPQARSRPLPAADSEEAAPSEPDPASTRSQGASPRLQSYRYCTSMLSHFFLSLTHSPFRQEPVGLECAPLPLQRHSPQAPRGNSGACFLSPDCMQGWRWWACLAAGVRSPCCRRRWPTCSWAQRRWATC